MLSYALARAAVATGVDGIFAEVHTDPSSSPSDSENMLRLDELEATVSQLQSQLHQLSQHFEEFRRQFE